MRKMNNSCRSLLVILVMVGALEMLNFCGADPIDGFTLVPLTESNFELQKPYDIPLDHRYSIVNGVHRYGFVPNGTFGATVEQIHGAAHGATTLILRIYDKDMRYYSRDLVATDLYDKWFRLNS
ncbi:hypothetical protein SO802_029054 [Lithocarpus litseifolius]|uniref:Uncharacterized protein n=1 Tax=Lithocarpus litseifolius TaxID=425828 RepID=A0AAW2BXP1_9ROSI